MMVEHSPSKCDESLSKTVTEKKNEQNKTKVITTIVIGPLGDHKIVLYLRSLICGFGESCTSNQ